MSIMGAFASATKREWLRHPMEKRIVTIVAVFDAILVLLVLVVLILGIESLALPPYLAKYRTHAEIFLIAVFGAPAVTTFMRRRRRLLAQEESIRVGPKQLPKIHEVLVSYCTRMGIPVPELYLSDGVDGTISFFWRNHYSIILSTHEFSVFPDAFDDIIEWALAREVGSICLGHPSYRNELLTAFVAPIPFLRSPLHHARTYSRDRYGAFLAPRAVRALIVLAAGDRLRNQVNLDAYFEQIDESPEPGFWARIEKFVKKRVPLAQRVQELRRAGMLIKC